MALLFFACAAVQAGELSKAEQVKVAYVYHFTRFISWPQEVLGDKAYFRICLLGKRYTAAVWRELEQKRIGDLPVRVITKDAGVDDCRLVFISASAGAAVDALLGAVQGRGVLTIGERPGFAASGGIIELYHAGGKLRFRINTDAAARAGLSISSRLLKLAQIVREGGAHP